MEFNITIKKEDEKTVKEFLKNNLYMSKRLILPLKSENKILVNEIPVFINYMLKEGDILKIYLDDNLNTQDASDNSDSFKDSYNYPLYEYPLDILYEDEYILIVNKPSNMPVHPSLTNTSTTLYNALKYYYISKYKKDLKIHIITRLDKDTSGACIIAKHKYIQELFIRKKDDIQISKTYIAAVLGIVTKKHDIIEKNIKRKEGSIILREVSNDQTSNYAKTEYTLEKINEKTNYSILKILLHTGRTHQIRVHMSSIGHPLLGDDLYYMEYINSFENIGKNLANNTYISNLIKRQALHSYELKFNHPITNKKIQIIADIPLDIKKLI